MSDRANPNAAPTLTDMMAALAILIEGALAVQHGTWDRATMQADRDWAHAVVARGREAGVM